MDTSDLIKEAIQGDKNAIETLVKDNSGLIWSIAKRFFNRGVEPDDLFQQGAIGLIKAIKKFDFSYEVKLSTYAVPMIMGEIKRFLRDDGIIKISRTLKENAVKIKALQEKEQSENNNNLSVSEISQMLSISCEEVVLALESCQDVDSLQKIIYNKEGDEVSLLERIDSDARGEDNIINNVLINETINSLSERDKKILELRYFRDKTQSDTAKIMGVSQVQISRLEKKILEQLRKIMCE